MALLTTHVGSLPRPPSVAELLMARERGEPVDPESFDARTREAVFELVRRQKAAGVDIVSDGEVSKISYATYVKDRYEGFAGDSPRNVPADLELFPSFRERLARQGGTPAYARPRCIGPIRPKGQGELERDIRALRAAMDAHGVARGFMNAASPGVVALFLPNAHYPDHARYLEALADALAEEYRAILASGLELQVDCPDLALARHMLFKGLSDEAFLEVASVQLEALAHALAGLPRERIRLHVCWGNYEGPHVCDLDLARLLPLLARAPARYLLIEAANPRHGHEWAVLREHARSLPDDTVLVPGLIDTTTNFVEHPELVAERLGRFVDIFGPERVIASTDCGFGSFAGFGAVDPEIAWAKLASLADGTRRLAERLGLKRQSSERR
jgi:5-methyltetrahydropteroyltriglutamate--homocysteine methyltransferase